ncbi:MAG: NUDIX hydrolase [Candidatus Eisenbacteria sp.]|nr:NUDIX hydrolase [Candidatus Eisenbacteria bacterium]
MSARRACPRCGEPIASFPFPLLTVDCIITNDLRQVLLIKRRFPPPGWALPGGFVEHGETLEEAVTREILEETHLQLLEIRQFHAYSDPARDRRHHIVSVVFAGKATGEPRAGDDAGEARFFPLDQLPEPLAFDHTEILRDYAAETI